MEIYVAIVTKHDDDYKPYPSTVTQKVFKLKEDAQKFVYQTLIENLGYYDEQFCAEEMEEYQEQRDIIKDIVYHDKYDRDSDEYIKVFEGHYLTYRAEYEIKKQTI